MNALIDGPSTRVVAVQVTDDDSGLVEISGTLVIANFAPVVDAGPDQRHPFDEVFTLDFDYVDTFDGDSQVARVDWGDGTIEEIELPASGAAQAAIANAQISHIYNQVGEFTINLCVTDSDGGTGCAQSVALAACREHGLTAHFERLGSEVRIILENVSGNVSIPSGLQFTLYDGETVLQTFTLVKELPLGASTLLTYVWPSEVSESYRLRLAADDDGSGVKSTSYCSGAIERHVIPRQNLRPLWLPSVQNNGPHTPRVDFDIQIYLPIVGS